MVCLWTVSIKAIPEHGVENVGDVCGVRGEVDWGEPRQAHGELIGGLTLVEGTIEVLPSEDLRLFLFLFP